MINLLPPHAQSALKKDYWLRVLTVWACLLTGVILGIAALLVPSYMLVESERRAIALQHAFPAETAEAIAFVEDEVKTANAFARELKRWHAARSVSTLIEAMLESVPAGVTLRSYDIVRTENGIETMVIVGVAGSRERLIAFQEALQKREEFGDAKIPIEDFVKERDLPFSVRITIADNFK
jgi:hypothetical protein